MSHSSIQSDPLQQGPQEGVPDGEHVETNVNGAFELNTMGRLPGTSNAAQTAGLDISLPTPEDAGGASELDTAERLPIPPIAARTATLDVSLPVSQNNFDFSSFLGNLSNDGTYEYIGIDLVRQLSEFLYGEQLGTASAQHLSEYNVMIAILCQRREDRVNMLNQIRCVVQCLSEDPGGLTVELLSERLRDTTEW